MKRYSLKFWTVFWLISATLLVGWYFLLQVKRYGSTEVFRDVIRDLPVDEKYKTVSYLMEYFLREDDIPKTFLVLFQNNLEIRPGGGFIGSFGIVKIKNGKIVDTQIHDTGNFDGRIPSTVKPPYPMEQMLKIKSWKLRDSNYSPDFIVNAKKAEKFYYMGEGGEKFDGVIGITTNVLTSFLKAIGPIEVEGYPGAYADENAVLTLEYQVEKGYVEQNIPKGERKSIMDILAKEIIKKVEVLDTKQKFKLSQILLEDLNKKDIQLYFKDKDLEDRVKQVDWAGKVDEDWGKDYLMAVDANLGAWKTDYYINRSMDYAVDISKETPEAVLKITYAHTATQRDFMTRDYLSYLRVYVPQGSWMIDSKNTDDIRFEEELGKKYFGFIVYVPMGETKTFEMRYALPREIRNGEYDLKIQKQAGIKEVPVEVHVLDNNGKKDYSFKLFKDVVLGEEK